MSQQSPTSPGFAMTSSVSRSVSYVIQARKINFIEFLFNYSGPLSFKRRLLNLPTPDQQPGHEDNFPKERDEKESKIGLGK